MVKTIHKIGSDQSICATNQAVAGPSEGCDVQRRSRRLRSLLFQLPAVWARLTAQRAIRDGAVLLGKIGHGQFAPFEQSTHATILVPKAGSFIHMDDAEPDMLSLRQRLEAVDGAGIVPAVVDVLPWHRAEPIARSRLGPVEGDPELIAVAPDNRDRALEQLRRRRVRWWSPARTSCGWPRSIALISSRRGSWSAVHDRHLRLTP